jgi:hypothetical protein
VQRALLAPFVLARGRRAPSRRPGGVTAAPEGGDRRLGFGGHAHGLPDFRLEVYLGKWEFAPGTT